MNLLELAERVEKAEGPDEDLDQAIGTLLWQDQTDEEPRNVFDCYQRYTASLDAAMTLVPEGAAWTAQQGMDPDRTAFGAVTLPSPAPDIPPPDFQVFAATPALALTAAALRARAAMETQ